MFDLWRRAAGLDPTTALTTLVPALTFIRCLAVGGKSILEFDRAMLAVGLYWDAEASTYRPISTTTDQSALPPADTHFRAISPNDAQPQISEDLCSSVRRILRDMERMQELIKYLYLGKTISGLSREEVADMPRQLQQLSERCNFTIPSSRVLDQPAAEEMITQLEQRCTSLMQTIESAEQLDLQPGTEVWVSRNRPDGGQYPEWGWQFQEITPEGRVRVTCEQNGVAKSKIIPLTDLTAQTAEPTT
ncbi:hypothetical protein KGQ71_02325 [Patescibacteria group bacterium]|nr:hypothetical protein [Patescibacteria group bacterium]